MVASLLPISEAQPDSREQSQRATQGVLKGALEPMQSKPDLRAALMAVTTLFFAWGFITSMIDPLIACVRTIFRLSYTQSMLTQFAFFFAYGVVSLPGAALVGRLGYG